MPQRTCGVDGCLKPHRARGLCSNHYNQQHYPDRHRKITMQCTVCGKVVLKHVSSRYRRVCSFECRWFLQFDGASCAIPEWHPAHPRWLDHRLPVVWSPLPAQVKIKPARTRWVAGNCKRCGTAFVDVWLAASSARYCSNPCARRDSKARRRARKRNAYVADVWRSRVFERDGWRCQLCRRMVNRTAVVPHPRAPVLDHIVPLAKGGTHEPANVQLACFMCNSVKSDRMAPAQQLALFG